MLTLAPAVWGHRDFVAGIFGAADVVAFADPDWRANGGKIDWFVPSWASFTSFSKNGSLADCTTGADARWRRGAVPGGAAHFGCSALTRAMSAQCRASARSKLRSTWPTQCSCPSRAARACARPSTCCACTATVCRRHRPCRRSHRRSRPLRRRRLRAPTAGRRPASRDGRIRSSLRVNTRPGRCRNDGESGGKGGWRHRGRCGQCS